MSEIIDVYDDVLELHVNEYIENRLQNARWKFGAYSNRTPKTPNRHWTIAYGENRQEVIDAGYDWILPIWDVAFHKYNFKEKYNMTGDFRRAYSNGYTHGIEPSVHRDDGDFTLLYYPNINWKLKWHGGTYFWEDKDPGVAGPATGHPGTYDDSELGDNLTKLRFLNEYVGNRLVVFDAHIAHQAQSISRECYDLRTMVVFKGQCDVGTRERLNYYKNN